MEKQGKFALSRQDDSIACFPEEPKSCLFFRHAARVQLLKSLSWVRLLPVVRNDHNQL